MNSIRSNPFHLTFLHGNGANWNEKLDQLSFVDQVLVQMYMRHRTRTGQALFHANPDHAYGHGWNEMTKNLGEIRGLAKMMRAMHTD